MPDPTHALMAEMRDYVTWDLGAGFSVGMSGRDEALLEWCRQAGIACEDLFTSLRYPGFGRHWTPEGHRWVAERLLDQFAD